MQAPWRAWEVGEGQVKVAEMSSLGDCWAAVPEDRDGAAGAKAGLVGDMGCGTSRGEEALRQPGGGVRGQLAAGLGLSFLATPTFVLLPGAPHSGREDPGVWGWKGGNSATPGGGQNPAGLWVKEVG